MCGITAFLFAGDQGKNVDLEWLERAVSVAGSTRRENLLETGKQLRQLLTENFGSLAGFELHCKLAASDATRAELRTVANCLDQIAERAAAEPTAEGEQLLAFARDYSWQISNEALGLCERVEQLIAGLQAPASRSQRLLGWAAVSVLDNLARLEVRGRDSAGIRIQLTLPTTHELPAAAAAQVATRRQASVLEAQTLWSDLTPAGLTFSFGYKVAEPIGRLGDNTRALAQMIAADSLLWSLARSARGLSIVAHTRWASNGIISIPNCHPVDLAPSAAGPATAGPAAFVLNGDVDNCNQILRNLEATQVQTEPRVTTDAKCLTLLYEAGRRSGENDFDGFSRVLNACEGLLAVVMQDAHVPDHLAIGLKGSGQSLYASRTADGWFVASEEYGLTAQSRERFALSGQSHGGMVALLDARAAAPSALAARYLEDGRAVTVPAQRIEIFSRDINRGHYDYYLEKELNDAPASIEKTIRHRYSMVGEQPVFQDFGRGTLVERLLPQLASRERTFDRILVIGQGTASIAAMGVAHLIRDAVGSAIPTVEHAKASEVSAWANDERMDSTLVVAISQSGTTTDTNRTVEWCMQRGAWAHAIVNRRGSKLMQLADSFTLTSDGRDVEMSVASTKAFYSQIAAGKVLAIAIARTLDVMTPARAAKELFELEALPGRVREVLSRSDEFRELAQRYAASSANWAIVGNGPNYIAAQEIRIKLSELCYKSIPCDYTEDKKHIDLSTEPLTIVVANDLPEDVAQDTAKEVSIFKAHAGLPIVFCAQGETRFDGAAERVIYLPRISAGLSFVLATAAGHLFGFHAAKAIDQQAQPLRELRATLTKALVENATIDGSAVRAGFAALLGRLASGSCNAALSSAFTAKLAEYCAVVSGQNGAITTELASRGVAICNTAISALTRPIDSIRHQAKTVTVGISRPEQGLPEAVLAVVEELGVRVEQLGARDLFELRVGAALAGAVPGGTLYSVEAGSAGEPLLRRQRSAGNGKAMASRYDEPKSASGSKRRVLRLRRLVWGRGNDGEAWCVLPVMRAGNVDVTALLLLHLEFPPCAAQAKAFMLRRLGRYDTILEQLEEATGKSRDDAMLDSKSVIELLAM